MATPAHELTEVVMKLRLSKEATEKLSQRAADAGQDVAAIASDLIEQAVTTHAENAGDSNRRLAEWEAWVADMRDWGRNHLPGGHVIDDGRESIYEGRGE